VSRSQFILFAVTAGAAVLIAGCAAAPKSGADAPRSEVAAASDKGAAQLWTENCSRCHNVRSPDYYTPGRWTLVAQHMRVRGYLTGAEERQITAFLQSQ
jgi:hypothetical protein